MFYQSQINIFFRHDFVFFVFQTKVYMLDILRFWSFGSFHHEKLPNYKRLTWGKLAGPSCKKNSPYRRQLISRYLWIVAPTQNGWKQWKKVDHNKNSWKFSFMNLPMSALSNKIWCYLNRWVSIFVVCWLSFGSEIIKMNYKNCLETILFLIKKVFFRRDVYDHYFSYATLATYMALLVAMLSQLPRRNIFNGLYIFLMFLW